MNELKTTWIKVLIKQWFFRCWHGLLTTCNSLLRLVYRNQSNALWSTTTPFIDSAYYQFKCNLISDVVNSQSLTATVYLVKTTFKNQYSLEANCSLSLYGHSLIGLFTTKVATDDPRLNHIIRSKRKEDIFIFRLKAEM